MNGNHNQIENQRLVLNAKDMIGMKLKMENKTLLYELLEKILREEKNGKRERKKEKPSTLQFYTNRG